MMYGQMTAGSWIYIGTQGIVQGTYETFARSSAASTYDGDLERQVDPDRWPRRHGRCAAARGDHGRAAAMLAVECDETRIDFRLRTRYVDEKATTLSTRRSAWIERRPSKSGMRDLGRASWATPPTCSPNS